MRLQVPMVVTMTSTIFRDVYSGTLKYILEECTASIFKAEE
jgi:hypothetical protein